MIKKNLERLMGFRVLSFLTRDGEFGVRSIIQGESLIYPLQPPEALIVSVLDPCIDSRIPATKWLYSTKSSQKRKEESSPQYYSINCFDWLACSIGLDEPLLRSG